MKRTVLTVFAIGLIGAQFYAAFADDSRAPKAAYAKEWTTPKHQTIQETIRTTGFTAPAERTFIYDDPERGAIDDILVESGQSVQAGTALLRYRTDAIDRELERLARKQQQLTAQIGQLTDDIHRYESLAAAAPESSPEKQQWDEKANEAAREKADLEWQLNDLEQQQTELLEQKDEQTVESPVDGIIEEVNPNPSSPSQPLITIASTKTVVRGKLDESHIGQLAVGQSATIRLPNQEAQLTGTIRDIGRFPIAEASFRQKSEYPFTIQLTAEPQPPLPFGYHAHITIVTKEKTGALTVPADAIERQGNNAFVYLIRDGQIQRQPVKLGMKQGNRQELEQGITGDEYIITRPTRGLKQGMDVWLPLNNAHLSKDAVHHVRKRDMAKYFLDGFLRAF